MMSKSSTKTRNKNAQNAPLKNFLSTRALETDMMLDLTDGDVEEVINPLDMELCAIVTAKKAGNVQVRSGGRKITKEEKRKYQAQSSRH